MTRREKRNEKIKREIRELRDVGWKIKEAIIMVADRYYLAHGTVRNIWYGR